MFYTLIGTSNNYAVWKKNEIDVQIAHFFLSHLCGVEVPALIMLRTSSFLSHLCGVEVSYSFHCYW